MRSVSILLAAGLGMVGTAAAASCQLVGKVTSDGLNLPDASISVTRQDREIARTRTDGAGEYALSYAEFPRGVRAVTVEVSADAHVADRRILFRQGQQACLGPRRHEVALGRSGEGDDFAPSTLGLTIFVSPYSLYGVGGEDVQERFNADLPQIVYHRIQAYKSLLDARTESLDFSVELTPEVLTPAQGEQIRRLGHQLNALGIVAGDGELVSAENAEPRIALKSVFRTIPTYRDVTLLMQEIEDELPAGRASPSRIGSRLQDYWGKQAVLSYAVRKLALDGGVHNIQELQELSSLLIQVRATMAQDDPLLESLQSLLTIIQLELGS